MDAVARRVAEVEAVPGQDLDARRLQRMSGRFLVLDDETEVQLLFARPRSNRATNWSPISRNAASSSLRSTAVGWNSAQ